MARTMFQFNVADVNEAYNNICYILSQTGFKNITERNENIWRWGTGLMTAAKYIKPEIAGEHLIIVSAWIRPMLCSEMPLDDNFVGLIPKQELNGVINVLRNNIR